MDKYSIFPAFFEGNEYFIDEKVNFFKFENSYRVYNEHGEQRGNIVQKMSGGAKALRFFWRKGKAMFPFTLEVLDMNGDLLVTISRGWTFWTSKIGITGANGEALGTIRQKFRFFKPTFRIFSPQEEQLAEITGDWKAWNFSITGRQGEPIGTITKKWAGAMREIFTTADKYYVSILPQVAEDSQKIAIVATAITIDMVLKESR